jgi:hypothetical protein
MFNNIIFRKRKGLSIFNLDENNVFYDEWLINGVESRRKKTNIKQAGEFYLSFELEKQSFTSHLITLKEGFDLIDDNHRGGRFFEVTYNGDVIHNFTMWTNNPKEHQYWLKSIECMEYNELIYDVYLLISFKKVHKPK